MNDLSGALQADGYAVFHHLYGEHVYEVACWAHARRKFHDIHAVHPSPTTTEALARIGALYAGEEQIRAKPADLRLVLARIADHPISQIQELLPWNRVASLQADSSQAA